MEPAPAVTEPLRVLIAGWLNSPHVISWAESVAAAGHEVHFAGRVPPGPARIEGANVYELSADGPPVLRSLRMSRALAEVADRVQPDLIHAHWLPEFGWMAAREGLHPLICSAWGSDIFGTRGIGRQRSKRALGGSDLVTADSVHLARATRELAGRDVPIEVVRWGLDLERFAPGSTLAAREALGLASDGPLVVSVRGFKAVYNVDLQLRAFDRFKEGRPGAHLLLKSPDGSIPPTLRTTIGGMGLEEAVTVLGDLPPERMPDVYRAADVVISIPSSDSSPRSVWEALACGRNVVVSDLPWARDELEDGRHAVLTPLEVDTIAAAIERAFGDDRLGAEGRALAQAELDPAECTARIDALYRSVVESSLRRATSR
jgi:glycosyltransferase involved in cell wall biosynthesis